MPSKRQDGSAAAKKRKPKPSRKPKQNKFEQLSVFVPEEVPEIDPQKAAGEKSPASYSEAKRKHYIETISGYLQLLALDKSLFDMKVLKDVVAYCEEYDVPDEAAMDGIRHAVMGDPPFANNPEQLHELARGKPDKDDLPF